MCGCAFMRFETGSFDSAAIISQHWIKMSTSLDSELAKRRSAARIPLNERNGFPVFQLPAGTPSFGLEDAAAAICAEDLDVARGFLES